MHDNAFILNDLGTGKTMAALWAYDYLRECGVLNRVLVVSPLSTLERTWADEIFMNFPHLRFAVLHGTRDKRLTLLEQEVDLYLINHDGIKTSGIEEALAKRPDIDLIIIDEIAQAGRNAKTDRWKALNRICNKQMPRRVWGMTGTPTPNGPLDAWAQCRLVMPKNTTPYFTRFRDSVMTQVGPFTWIPRSTAVDTVKEIMQPAVRFTRDQCTDLPPCMYQTQSVDLTPDQDKAYKAMVRNLAAELELGDVHAVNEAVKVSKLLQIVCGVVYNDDHEEVVLDATPRMDVVHNIIEQAGTKTIVFVPFVSVAEHLAAYLRGTYGHTVEVIHGGVNKADRDRIFSLFQKTDTPEVLVAQPGAMSHGLTLTAANTIVWYAPITSNETYEQANGRIVRPGQNHTQFVVNIEGSPVERKIYARLRDKQKMQGVLLDLLQASSVYS